MPIRIGLCSMAHGHAFSYLKCLQTLPGVEVVGVWDEVPSVLKRVSDQFGVPTYSDLNALLISDLDAVIICSPNSRHRHHVEMSAVQVPNILCEKPIATSEADGLAMLEVCRDTDTRLQIAFPVRFAPAITEAKRFLDQGELGTVYSASCTNQGSMPGGWFVNSELSGGGAVIDHTVHVIDLLRWFWGTEVTEVYAEIGYSLLHPGLGIDDAGLLSFQLANGVYGTLDTSWSRPPAYRIWGNVSMDLVGSEGVLAVNAFGQALTLTSEDAGRTHLQPWGISPDMGLIRDFVDMIRLGREPSISGYDGLQATRVALAAYRSAKEGVPISLPPAPHPIED